MDKSWVLQLKSMSTGSSAMPFLQKTGLFETKIPEAVYFEDKENFISATRHNSLLIPLAACKLSPTECILLIRFYVSCVAQIGLCYPLI